ncbi:hypothetical protein ARMGADRAFT_1038410 [Armillaria gallica]|uniref:Uncharacterized protein n=1 Tax=Armillaria gallica TaxID=47427 RepID=A0A2H3CMY5_ARMGA|nr:hypothetical protein ARMGADRAFT_1038410 [Armillaria gallica]
MSANTVYNSIKSKTPPTVCSTQAPSASEEEAFRFMFFKFDHIAKGDKKEVPLLCLAEWNSVAATGLAKLDYSPLFTSLGEKMRAGDGLQLSPSKSFSTQIIHKLSVVTVFFHLEFAMNVHTYYLLIVPARRSPAENVVTMLSSNGNQILELTQELFSLCLKLFLHSEIQRLKQMERIGDLRGTRHYTDNENAPPPKPSAFIDDSPLFLSHIKSRRYFQEIGKTNAVERMHADVEHRILLAHAVVILSTQGAADPTVSKTPI